MPLFPEACEAIAATTKKLEKTALVADYLRAAPPAEAAIGAIFLSGRPFPAYEQATLHVGAAMLWRVIADLSGKSDGQLTEIYRLRGDAGSVAADALPQKPPCSLALSQIQQSFFEIAAARLPSAKTGLVRQLLDRATPLEAKYIVKIITGDLRIGLKESLVEEAIARAFSQPLAAVKRANMLLGDIGATLSLALVGNLDAAQLRIFHPLDLMLASPVPTAEEALSYFQNAAVEDKYDGIRAQAHIRRGEVRIFSRTRDEITASFPELASALARWPNEAILDGEIIAFSIPIAIAGKTGEAKIPGRALPFSTLQQRLGRKKVSAKLMREIPIAYVIFDVIHLDRELLLDRPLRERASILEKLMTGDALVSAPDQVQPVFAPSQASFGFAATDLPKATLLRSPVSIARTQDDIESLFAAARNRGNEGLMIKDLDSLYTPGRRGKSWLKMKRELATLDVVVTAVEYGHGKRIGVLSDYTFAVWDGENLVNIGKAYSGLTDAEIADMTRWFLDHKIRELGFRMEVEPKIVLEVAFNNLMLSTRHESGYALRFPRIVRLRPDKLPKDADSIETVREIYQRQSAGTQRTSD